MLRTILALFTVLALAGEVSALTVSWNCNPETDMQEYRVEYSADSGASWGVEATVPHPKPCTSPVSLGITRYLKPGPKLYRVFALDRASNASKPSDPASYTVKPPLIGNTGGQEETAIPPSPYKPSPTPAPPPPIVTPPPPVIVPPPPAPVVVKPAAIPSMATSDIQPKSAVITVAIPEGAKVDVRFGRSPMSWGSAAHAICNEAGRCELLDLEPGTDYDYQGVPYFGAMNQGAIYGPLSDVKTFTTATIPLPPPVPPLPPVPPSPLGLKEALQSGLDTCLKNKLAHTACMKALSEAVGKVNQ